MARVRLKVEVEVEVSDQHDPAISGDLEAYLADKIAALLHYDHGYPLTITWRPRGWAWPIRRKHIWHGKL